MVPLEGNFLDTVTVALRGRSKTWTPVDAQRDPQPENCEALACLWLQTDIMKGHRQSRQEAKESPYEKAHIPGVFNGCASTPTGSPLR